VAPIVSAGADASVSVLGAATLDGTVTDDGKPGPSVTTTWSKISGPGEVTFADPAAQDTTATFSEPGSYTLRLTANDGELSGSDDVVIQVRGTPVVSAGPDRIVTFPTAASLDGTVSAGPILTTWSKVSGPGNVTFANANLVDTTATFSLPGSYTLRLTATDGALSASDDMVVEVRQAPQVSAGPDRSIKMPAAASLDGTLITPGYPGAATVRWTKVSGPGTVTFSAATSIDTQATFSKNGNYTLRLTATNGALSGFDEVVVKVAKK
jgi:PKD repeat protein